MVLKLLEQAWAYLIAALRGSIARWTPALRSGAPRLPIARCVVLAAHGRYGAGSGWCRSALVFL